MVCLQCGSAYGCGCNPISPLGQPWYASPCQICQESHEKLIYLHRYVASLSILNSWIVPAVNSIVTLDVPCTLDIPVGPCIWHVLYGYFQIIGVDPVAMQIRVENIGTDGNAAPGSPIPPCSKFILTPPPIVPV